MTPLNLSVPVPVVFSVSAAAVPLMIPLSRFDVPAAELTVSADDIVMALARARDSDKMSVFVPAALPTVNVPDPNAEPFEI